MSQQLPGQEEGPYRDAAIGDIKNRPNSKIEEIDDGIESEPIHEISDGSTQDEPQAPIPPCPFPFPGAQNIKK